MKRRDFVFTLPAIVGTSSFRNAHAAAAPLWSSVSTFSIQQGQIYSLGSLCADPQGLPLVFSALATLPFGVVLDQSTGSLAVSGQTASGSYGVRFRAFNGLIAADSPYMTLSVTVVPVSNPSPTPVSNSSLVITPSFNFKKDLKVTAGVFWNKYQVDKRGGIIGWCDGDHGEYGGDANSVRYFNTGQAPFHGIGVGQVGYLVQPITTAAGAKVSEYDNYPWWYLPSDDKFFWLSSAKQLSGDRGGIFDLGTKKWSHGNGQINASQWPSGPHWTDYVKPLSSSFQVRKNPPNAASEALDVACAISGSRLFIIERNPDHPKKDKEPRRISLVDISAYPYKIVTESHNEFMNTGVCVGEWFYFIRPASLGERATYPNQTMREFWRVRLVPPYNQYEKLAYFPRFDINPVPNVAAGRVNTAAWGPLLSYDSASRSIFAVYDRLWLYDIDSDAWADRTPKTWQRILYAVGGTIPRTREIVYRPGINVDIAKGSSDVGSWSRLALSGGGKPRGRLVPLSMNMTYPGGSTSSTPWSGGKHFRFIYSPRHKTVGGQTINAGYVWQFGGDYTGVPSSQRANYPTISGSQSWSDQSSRQDCYRAPVAEIGGKVTVEMSSNYVAFYPYPGSLNPATTQRGPKGPDGVGVVFDKRGDAWVGPGYYRFGLNTNPPSVGDEEGMFRYRLPEKHTDGVRKGNGWFKPKQNFLRGSSAQQGDIGIGDAGTGVGLFGVSNCWTTYDPKDDCVVLCSVRNTDKFSVLRFPCTPNGSGSHMWTRVTQSRASATLISFLNGLTRNGASYGGSSQPSNHFVGAQTVVGDDAFVVCTVGGGGGYGDRKVAYLMRVNLRNLADHEYIRLPTHWVRGFDAPPVAPALGEVPGSIPEFRDIQALGHLIVLSPPSLDYVVSEPWLYWYDTNTRAWTAGQTWQQMRSANASLPAKPNTTKGAMCCVPETGEVWYMANKGVVKYRVW